MGDVISHQPVIDIAHQAGQAIMQIYQRNFDISTKADTSPLTEADLAAHNVIVKGLQTISDLPILSEESANIPWQQRQQWDRYWLVDPLDGTKEFIKKNGEFTVNIALINQGQPVWGVVYAPVLQKTYVGDAHSGAYVIDKGSKTDIRVQPHRDNETWQVVGSRSHQSPEIQDFLNSLPGETNLVAMGSSLKLCLVAEGVAHVYPRLGPTSEWDTAAAQAVVEAAGGQVTIHPDGQPLRYNQKESVLNPYFVVNCKDE
ncbi:3'(2'),5'-bisphosphate nucleotidase CysQ [Neptunicella sp. SCSIO 80796]|uniref:3'(2'),5'-bisphosphate nucleotidase CysQ n=1 Tax=Neptunicella plasticusilytica TaxID=3117012 RepID=UPI003A4E3AF2